VKGSLELEELVGEERAKKSRTLLRQLLERHSALQVEQEALQAQEGVLRAAEKQAQELEVVVQGRRRYIEEDLQKELIEVLIHAV